jgi:cell division protein FtsB
MSWRTLVLVCIIALAAALVLPSLRVYIDQQQELAALRAERDAAHAEVDDLTAEIARWDDPAFIVAQARERLAYVFPGETPYRVVDPEFVTASAPDSAAGLAESDPTEGLPWYDAMWGSVLAVGDEHRGVAVTPSEAPASESEQLTPVDFGG